MDCILVANEECRRLPLSELILKLDLEKVYDYTNCYFLDYTMARKGFDSKWGHGFMVALNPLTLCIDKWFAKCFLPASCKSRQGDPLSPFLFTLVAHAFSQILKNRENCNLIQRFRPSPINNMPIIHCFF